MSGHRYLGGFIGDLNQRDVYVQEKVNKWVNHVCVFSDIAVTQLQLAYTAVARSLQYEWTFLLRCFRIVGCCFAIRKPHWHVVFFQLSLVLKSY